MSTLLFLIPAMSFAQTETTNPAPAQTAISPATNTAATNALPAPVGPAPDQLPWLTIIGVALILGCIAFVILRLTGGEKKGHSGGRSRGGWVLSSSGMGEAQGAAAGDDDSSGNSSSNFTGDGAGSNW